MVQKQIEKERAVALRGRGLSYREILRRVPVAKSTLSLWLREVGLSKRQKQRLTEKKLAAARRGIIKIMAMRNARIAEAKRIAHAETPSLISDPLWLVGTALYWAEGSKMKPWRRGEKVVFSNMDPLMILVFRKWLTKCLKVRPVDIKYEIYIHRNSEYRLAEVKQYWAELLKCNPDTFYVYFKKHNLKNYRKNIGNGYKGLLRIKVRRSAALNHKISGWIEGICRYCRVV